MNASWSHASRGVIVLLVEDDPGARALYRSALRDAGYAVVAVADGVDALTYLDTHTPAAVVLDLGLPRLHGRDVIGEMAAGQLTDRIPVVVVTGEAPTESIRRQVACVLEKPVDMEELRAAVRRCLERANRSRQAEQPEYPESR